jgi:hypothetical protein
MEEEEEEDAVYRRRALDYAWGHVATSVRDDRPRPARGAFFEDLVRSAAGDEEEITTTMMENA